MKRNWNLSEAAFQRFLHWLDDGVDSRGERYLEMRRRLVFYFDRRNCTSPEDLADEVLDRIVRKLEEKGDIIGLSPAHYCYVVAKFVFLENVRAPENRSIDINSLSPSQEAAPQLTAEQTLFAQTDAKEAQFSHLQECLAKLQPTDRGLILEYYQGEKRTKIDHRLRLAQRLSLTMNALAIRVCRIRTRLEACVKLSMGNT